MSPEYGFETDDGALRTFETGATRDTADDKLDYEGFLCPYVLERYAQYMHQHRRQSDGSLRAADNWQKGIPQTAYMKSLIRHVFTLWGRWRGAAPLPEKVGGRLVTPSFEDVLCAILFNAAGLLHERLKASRSMTDDTKIYDTGWGPSGTVSTSPSKK